MKKIILILCLFNSVLGPAAAQLQKGQINSALVPELRQHYLPEYTFDAPVDTAAWAKTARGMQVSFGSADALYFRSEVPALQNKTLSWEAAGWKGERLNTQILVWSADTLEQVRFEHATVEREERIQFLALRRAEMDPAR